MCSMHNRAAYKLLQEFNTHSQEDTYITHRYASAHLMVERVLRVGLIEQIDEAIDDSIDVQHRLPVLSQDVEADVPLQVDVGVVYCSDSPGTDRCGNTQQQGGG